MKTYCAYIHARPNGLPFYIGKANNLDRPYRMKRNKHHDNIVKKYGTHNIKVRIIRCRDEAHAFAMEIQIIADLSAVGFKLTNMTDGGEGTSGRKATKEQSAALGLLRMGNKNGAGNTSARGCKHTDEQKAAKSARMMGNKRCVGYRLTADQKTMRAARMVGCNRRGKGKAGKVRDGQTRKFTPA